MSIAHYSLSSWMWLVASKGDACLSVYELVAITLQCEAKRDHYQPGGTTFTICVNMRVQEFTEKGAFSEWGSDLSRSEKRVYLLADLGNKGTFFMTLFIVWSYFGIFLAKCSSYNGHSQIFMLPFRDKGIFSLLILLTLHIQILDLVVHLWVKDAFLRERLRKGCDSSIMNFRDMGAFRNPPNTHVNIGFYLSDPPRDYQSGVSVCVCVIRVPMQIIRLFSVCPPQIFASLTQKP